MEQQELFDIPNPCIQVCEMDDKGYCKGCYRNRKERDLWFLMNDSQKRQVLRLLLIRKLKKQKAKAISISPVYSDSLPNEDSNLSLFEDNTEDGL